MRPFVPYLFTVFTVFHALTVKPNNLKTLKRGVIKLVNIVRVNGFPVLPVCPVE